MIPLSLDNAKKEKLFYVVATAMIYRSSDSRCLILKRSMKEKVHPGKYCAVGGKLEWSDLSEPDGGNDHILGWWGRVLEKLVIREVREESNLEIEDISYMESVAFIRPDNVPVVYLKFMARYSSGEVRIAEEFDDYRWVSARESKSLSIISELDQEVAKTIDFFTKKAV